jgi:hypothetical protein
MRCSRPTGSICRRSSTEADESEKFDRKRKQDERAERVVGADTRPGVLGHLLLENREPEAEMDGDPGAGDRRDGDERGHRQIERDGQHRDAVRDRSHARCEQRPAWTQAQGDEPTDDRSDTEGADDGGPGSGAAEALLRHQRPQHEVRSAGEVPDPEEHDRCPDPGVVSAPRAPRRSRSFTRSTQPAPTHLGATAACAPDAPGRGSSSGTHPTGRASHASRAWRRGAACPRSAPGGRRRSTAPRRRSAPSPG